MIESCNIINNSISKSDSGIIVHSGKTLSASGCSFIKNTAPEGSFLICNYNELTIWNCYIDDLIPNTFYKNVLPKNSKAYFTNRLVHLSTGNCQAEFENINKSNRKLNQHCFVPIVLNYKPF